MRVQRAQYSSTKDYSSPIKLETGLRPNSAGIPYTLLLRFEAIGFPTFWLLLYTLNYMGLRSMIEGILCNEAVLGSLSSTLP